MPTPPKAPPIPTIDVAADPLEPDTIRVLAERMIVARELDLAAVRWQRQGLLPAFAPAFGQEAAQVGSASALEPRDYAFITYRDHGVVVGLEASVEDYMISHLGLWNGGFGDPNVHRHSPLQAVVGATGLHAAGWGLAQKLDGTGAVAVAYHGDGASSQGDVHEAMNFAAVMQSQVVFFVQNNQWSLSTPIHKQVAGLQVAPRAAGYGIPALQVDGDDVVAVYRAMQAALAHARENGPVMIEAFTYRRGPHATSDDPSRYRTLEEEQSAGTDALTRVRELVNDDAWWEASVARAQERVEAVHSYLSTLPPINGDDMFDYVFVEKTPQLVAQQAQWREETDHV